jgi:hypothetical protein
MSIVRKKKKMIKNIKTPEAEVIRLKSLLNGAFLDLKQAEVTRLKLVKKIKKLESRKK